MTLAEMIAGKIAELRAEKGTVEMIIKNPNSTVLAAIEANSGRFLGSMTDHWGIQHCRVEVPSSWTDKEEIRQAHLLRTFNLTSDNEEIRLIVPTVPPFVVAEYGSPEDMFTFLAALSKEAADTIAD